MLLLAVKEEIQSNGMGINETMSMTTMSHIFNAPRNYFILVSVSDLEKYN